MLSPSELELAKKVNGNENVLSVFKKAAQTELKKVELTKAIPENEREYFYLNEQSFRGQIIPHQKIPEYQDEVTLLVVEGVFAVLDLAKTKEIVTNLQAQFLSEGYLLFATEYNYIENQGKIILIKGSSQYDILTIQLTNGTNYDLSNRDIVQRLQKWENICCFQILGADFDWVELQFENLPSDLNTFAEEIYQFCPDTLEQGYVGESLTEEANWEDLEKALEEQTPTDLAQYLLRTKNLFLWWD